MPFQATDLIVVVESVAKNKIVQALYFIWIGERGCRTYLTIIVIQNSVA